MNGELVLKLLSHSKEPITGLYYVSVMINGKRYDYVLSSEFGFRMFINHYRRGGLSHRNAVAVLNRFKVKDYA